MRRSSMLALAVALPLGIVTPASQSTSAERPSTAPRRPPWPAGRRKSPRRTHSAPCRTSKPGPACGRSLICSLRPNSTSRRSVQRRHRSGGSELRPNGGLRQRGAAAVRRRSVRRGRSRPDRVRRDRASGGGGDRRQHVQPSAHRRAGDPIARPDERPINGVHGGTRFSVVGPWPPSEE
jgi:hypothetical protein